MENRKYLIIMLFLSTFLFSTNTYAYPTEVHEFITQEALRQYSEEILYSFSDKEKEFIVEGASHEDTTPRWMNHFFDPIYKRGLSSDPVINPFLPIGKWNDAPTWANSWEEQDKSLYKSFQMFSDSSIFNELNISKTESTYTWNKALYEWIQGDKNKSLFILGHILHLVQDMFVPDHTRNDAHPVSSPYEDYTEELLTKGEICIEKTRPIPSYNTLEEYCINAALYSNENFYSEDTIGAQSGYNNPTPSSYEIYNERTLLSRDGKEGEEEKVFLAVKTSKYGSNIVVSKEGISINDKKVLKSYWDHLSPRAIAYTAGVVNFFFSEVERYRDNPDDLLQGEKEFFLGNVFNAIESSFNKIGDNLLEKTDNKKTYTFLVGSNNTSVDQIEHKKDSNVTNESSIVYIENEYKEEEDNEELEENNERENENVESEKNFISCDINSRSPQYFPIVFSEIAWMGSTDDSSHEWIEISNISSSKINVDGWSIKNKDNSIEIIFNDMGVHSLDPGEIILFERTDDDAVPHITSDGVYKGALRNSGDDMFMFDDDCRLIDFIAADNGWPAGDNSSKKTMERDVETLVWYTSSRIHGTPKGMNSKYDVDRGEEEEPVSIQTPTPTPTPTPSVTPTPSSRVDDIVYADISISEIMYDLEGNDMGREWIEIRNEEETPVTLDGWKFFEHDTYHHISHVYGNKEIGPGGYAVIADKPEIFLNEYHDFEGSIFDSSFSLSNEGELLALYAGDILVDSYSYQSVQGGSGNGNSLQLYEGEWGEGFPSPGHENNHNPIVSEETENEEIITIDHIVISEVQVSGEFGAEEFIELYNPLSESVDVSNYSLQYISGRNESIGNVYKIHLEGEIKGKSFLLLANKDSSFLEIADKTFSFSLSGQETGGLIVLAESTDPIESINDTFVVDYLAYGSENILPVDFIIETPPDNKSIERKALYKGKCVDPLGDYEFEGNGCDRDVKEDFIIRDEPFPQNSYSQKEPRGKPINVSSVDYLYDELFRTVSLRWEYDNENASFIVEDKGEEVIVYETENTAFNINLKELNTTHTISIYAKDEGGYISEPVVIQESFFPESFIQGANFYVKDGRAVVDIYIQESDFIPDFFGRGSEGALVFSINRSPLDGEMIELSPTSDFSNWPTDEKDDVMKVTFRSCRGDRTADMIPIKNVSGDCGIAYDVERLQEGIIRMYPNIQWDPRLLTEDDYISISFYNLYSNWTRKVYKNIGIDTKKYFFSKEIAEHNIPPTPPQNVHIVKSDNEEYVLWDPSHDQDGFDNAITYQIAIIPPGGEVMESSWSAAYVYYTDGELRGPRIQYTVPGTYTIHMRAIDEFGTFSDLSTLIVEK